MKIIELLRQKAPSILFRFWYPYEYILKREIMLDSESLLDVGCGPSSPIKNFSNQLKYVVGVELYQPSIEQSKKNGIHHKYLLANALNIYEDFGPKSFDCVVALDLIEHLTKEDGYKLITSMEKVAKKRVVIFTPNGFVPQPVADNNLLQEHLSGWDPQEMTALGFTVYGMNGWGNLRGERANIRFWPKWFWVLVSKISQLIVETRPRYAFQILCVKDLHKVL